MFTRISFDFSFKIVRYEHFFQIFKSVEILEFSGLGEVRALFSDFQKCKNFKMSTLFSIKKKTGEYNLMARKHRKVRGGGHPFWFTVDRNGRRIVFCDDSALGHKIHKQLRFSGSLSTVDAPNSRGSLW